MKVLDLFCGMGGWSVPFIEDGDEVWGIDINDYGYPGKLILADIRELDGYGFSDMDLIIGSPPCRDFSTQTQANLGYPNRKPPNPQEGMKLVREFSRVVSQARPQFWAMENVSRLETFYKEPPIWRFLVSIRGKRTLWGNIPFGHTPEFVFKNRFMEWNYREHSYKKRSALRSKIPYPIARFVADTVKMR